MRAAAIVAAALVVVAARACVWTLDEDAGNRVAVTIAPTTWPPPADATGRLGTFVRADGAHFLLERAYLAWARLELVACDGEVVSIPLAPLSGMARAHTTTSRTELAHPWVEPLVTAEPTLLGELAPPSATYCKVIVGAAAAPLGADGAPPDLPALEGASLYLEGFYRPSGALDWQPFTLRETASFDVIVPLDARRIADGQALALTLTKDARAWFDGVDPTSAEAARHVLEQLQRTIDARVEAQP